MNEQRVKRKEGQEQFPYITAAVYKSQGAKTGCINMHFLCLLYASTLKPKPPRPSPSQAPPFYTY